MGGRSNVGRGAVLDFMSPERRYGGQRVGPEDHAGEEVEGENRFGEGREVTDAGVRKNDGPWIS